MEELRECPFCGKKVAELSNAKELELKTGMQSPSSMK